SALDPQINLHPLLVLLNDSVILAQGMALPTVGKQNALQVGMSVEVDAEHVVHFALQPVRCGPVGYYAGRAGAVRDHRLYSYAHIALEGIQNPNQIELLLA